MMEIKSEPDDIFFKDIVIKREYLLPDEKDELTHKKGKYLVEIPGLFRDILVKEEYCSQGDVLADTKFKNYQKDSNEEPSPPIPEGTQDTEKPRKIHKCEICGMIFTRACILKNHTVIHIGKKIYECAHCSKKFALKAALARHLVIHMTLHPISCSICQKKLKNKVVLQQHVRLLHKARKEKRERRHECSSCGRRFFARDHMQRHILTVHEGKILPWIAKSLYSHTCEECGKSFRSKYSLSRHSLVHSNERSFCCTVCSQKFKQKYNLEQHMGTHNTDISFSCDSCDKSFTIKHRLKYHKINKHTSMGKCPQCKKSFAPSYLKFHIANQHPEDL